MPYSVEQYVLFEIPYLEWYLYVKLGTPIQGRGFRLENVVIRSRVFGVGHATIQGNPSEI